MEKRWQMLWRRGAKRRGWEGRWNVERRENGRPSKWKNSTGVNDREEEIAVRSVITIAEAIIPEAHGQRYFFRICGSSSKRRCIRRRRTTSRRRRRIRRSRTRFLPKPHRREKIMHRLCKNF